MATQQVPQTNSPTIINDELRAALMALGDYNPYDPVGERLSQVRAAKECVERALEFESSRGVLTNEPPVILTDDVCDIQQIVEEIEETPHKTAARILRLERAVFRRPMGAR